MIHSLAEVRKKNMFNHWVRFEGKPYSNDRESPRVTIGPQKVMLLNPKAFALLGEPEAVELYFDSGKKRIGVKRTSATHDFAFPVKPKKDSHYRVVYAGAFCNHFGIEIERTVQFHNLNIDRDGIMSLEMTTATNVRRGAR